MRREPHGTAGVTLLALVVLVVGLVPGRAVTQELAGVALDPEGRPLADTPVVLHRVGGGGGAFIASDTTDADGAFRFYLEPAETGVYFAALRYDEGIYIGPAIEAGGDAVTDYVLRVEPGSEAGAVASALARPGPLPATAPSSARTGGAGGSASDPAAFVLVGLLALAAAAAFVVAAPRYRERRTRDALIRLATVENSLAGAAGDERPSLVKTRDRLRKQLAPRS